jgi:hypothetical protein
MSDTLEHQLHGAFGAKLGNLSPSVVARVCATDYRPKQRGLPRIPILSGAIATIAACAAAALLLLSSGTTNAFAGWTAQPMLASANALAQARAVCGDVPARNVIGSEARGPFVAIVYTRASSPWACVSHGDDVFVNQTTPYPPNVFASPGAGKVTLPVILASTVHGAGQTQMGTIRKRELQMYDFGLALERRHRTRTRAQWQALTRAQQSLARQTVALVTGPDSLRVVSGAVGARVTGVTLVLADGTRVAATVRHQWYLAWWPGVATHNAYPVAIKVTTDAGTTTTRYGHERLRALFDGCLLTVVCHATRIKLRSGVAPQLKQHFSLFRDTPPASGRLLRELEPGAWSVSIGADVPQLRAVSLGRRRTVIAIPGTGGVCVEIAQFDTDRSGLGRADRLAVSGRADGFGADYGTCSPYQSDALSRDPYSVGLVMSSYSKGLDGTSAPTGYSLLGIVPDGNPTVTVHLASGRTAKVRVKQNILFDIFTVQLTSVVYKNAAGRPIIFRPHY